MKAIICLVLAGSVSAGVSSCSRSSKDVVTTIVDTASSIAGVWVKTNALPVAFTERYSAVAFQIGNYAYVGSGSDAYENPLTDFWRYDPSDDSWTEIVPLPIGRVSAVAFAIDGTGYVGTGWDPSSLQTINGNDSIATKYFTDFYAYSPSANEWKRIADFPGGPRAGAVGFTLNSKGYVALGAGSDSTKGTGATYLTYNDMYAYDPSTGTWTRAADFPGGYRSYPTAFVYDNEAYLLGGTGITPNGFYKYSPDGNTWTEIQDLINYSAAPGGMYANIIPRTGSVSFVIDSTAFITGGASPVPASGVLLNYTWAYHFKSKVWERRPAFAYRPFVGGVAFTINGKGYVGTGVNGGAAYYPGGNKATAPYIFSDFYVFHPDSTKLD